MYMLPDYKFNGNSVFTYSILLSELIVLKTYKITYMFLIILILN